MSTESRNSELKVGRFFIFFFYSTTSRYQDWIQVLFCIKEGFCTNYYLFKSTLRYTKLSIREIQINFCLHSRIIRVTTCLQTTLLKKKEMKNLKIKVYLDIKLHPQWISSKLTRDKNLYNTVNSYCILCTLY